MKKNLRNVKKLSVSKQTIRRLSIRQLRLANIMAAGPQTNITCPAVTCQCTD